MPHYYRDPTREPRECPTCKGEGYRAILRRVGRYEQRNGCIYRCHYETPDGRFRVIRTSGLTDGWQAQAMDGTRPFRGWAGKGSEYFNCDTLTEAREEIAGEYECFRCNGTGELGDLEAVPDVEVFYWEQQHMSERKNGFYYQPSSGRDPVGPFNTEAEALAAAREE